METHVPRGLMTTCGAEAQRLSQFVHGRRLRSFGVHEIRVVRVGASCRVGGRDTAETSTPATADPARTTTPSLTSGDGASHLREHDHPRQMINGSQPTGLINFRYTALGNSHVRPGGPGVRDRSVKEERCEVREMLQPYIDKPAG